MVERIIYCLGLTIWLNFFFGCDFRQYNSNVKFLCDTISLSSHIVSSKSDRGVIQINDSIVVWSAYRLVGDSLCEEKNLVNGKTIMLNECMIADLNPPYFLEKRKYSDTVIVNKLNNIGYFIITDECGAFKKE